MELTPTQAKCMETHKAFLAKIARQAIPDTGISCPSASAKIPLVVLIEPDVEAWTERQKEIPLPPPKQPWFSIVGEIAPPPPITVRQVIAAVATEFNSSTHEVLSSRRLASICLARQVAMFIAKELTSFSFPALGKKFGYRDHSTVLHGVRKIQRLWHADNEFMARIERLKTKIRDDHNARYIHDAAPAAASSAASPDRVSPVAHGPGAAALHSPR